MPFNIGLSGLNAAQADLQTTGNNVSNSGTTGFKRSRAEFGDVFAQSFGGISQTAIGSGTRLQAVTQQFSQGRTEFTENGLDLAIDGEGFFVLNDQGSTVYTRAGEFQVNRDGFLENNQGQQLQGYPPQNPNTTDPDFNTGQLGDIRLQTGDAPPQATSQIEALVNLRSDAEAPEDDFDLTDPDTYNFSSSLTVYDSLGTARDATVYFVKGDGNREWTAHVGLDDGTDPYGSFDLEFDGSGALSSVDPEPAQVTVPTAALGNGAEPLVFEMDFDGTTQYGGDFSVNDLNQDGFASGRLTGVDIDSSGVVFARFTNGQSSVLGQVAMANFRNPQGLEQLGNNNWAETFAAGDRQLGAPGTSNLGTIQAGALEASNVDIAQELVNLITAQRNFQANAQTISTADQVTQTIINIR
ncbi:flagellar hook protein FlgE [Thioalkalivibrio sp. AKL10]|uniref:flagellar hook protein FlgE n=1 Tax=Thioalkalivibrio sp. AKL10 TaxID=1158158 RepID=UPI00037A5E9A|nr:flagellar hook protein FlgE [Thioalkalivibrio sp. AKL10]